MQRVYCAIVFFLISATTVWSQSYNPAIADLTFRVDSIYQKILEYERLGVKRTGSFAFDSATKWLVNKYAEMGYDSQIDTFRVSSGESYNIIIEQPGTLENKWIIVGAHYDSKAPSPGANDNGSGVIATLEIARQMQYVVSDYGIRIINFGAEEDGLLGSKHYVQNTLDRSEEIKLMFNLDQLGGTKGLDNGSIVCERDERPSPEENNAASWLATDTLMELIRLYTDLNPVIGPAFSTDYIPFEDEGYVITGLYQESSDPHYHTASDITLNMDTEATTQVIKGALAATLYFSQIKEIASNDADRIEREVIYPNPASNLAYIEGIGYQGWQLKVYNTYGQSVLSDELSNKRFFDVSTLPVGSYYVHILNHENSIKRYAKLIIAR